jgi:hypothetical protein
MGERPGGTPETELLVAILIGHSKPCLDWHAAAAAWSLSLPRAAFVIAEHAPSPAMLEAFVSGALLRFGLRPSRLLLVGLGDGAKVGFSVTLQSPRPICASLLAYGAVPDLDVDPPLSGRQTKIRLIGHISDTNPDDQQFARAVRRLCSLGVDVRGTLLTDLGLTTSSIRLGAAYLGELSASALDGSPRG